MAFLTGSEDCRSVMLTFILKILSGLYATLSFRIESLPALSTPASDTKKALIQSSVKEPGACTDQAFVDVFHRYNVEVRGQFAGLRLDE